MTAKTDEQERRDFERFMSDDGKFPQAIERDANGDYVLMQAASSWHVWRTAIALDRQGRGEPAAWINEDELPDNYPYDDMYPYSKVDGVRMFPVFAPQPAAPVVKESLTVAEPVKVPSDDAIADIVRDHLTAAYVCNRVWEAWNVGTMSQDDFVEASETEMADEIAAAVVARYGQPTASVEPKINWPAVQVAIKEYVDGYEMIGESDCVYDPTGHERHLLADAIHGLLADSKFLTLLLAAPAAAQSSVPTGLIAALRNQRQIDRDGSQVAVSRQAVDEAADLLDKLATQPADGQAQQAVTFVHELAMGAYKPEEIDARAIEIAKMAPLQTQQERQP